MPLSSFDKLGSPSQPHAPPGDPPDPPSLSARAGAAPHTAASCKCQQALQAPASVPPTRRKMPEQCEEWAWHRTEAASFPFLHVPSRSASVSGLQSREKVLTTSETMISNAWRRALVAALTASPIRLPAVLWRLQIRTMTSKPCPLHGQAHLSKEVLHLDRGSTQTAAHRSVACRSGAFRYSSAREAKAEMSDLTGLLQCLILCTGI